MFFQLSKSCFDVLPRVYKSVRVLVVLLRYLLEFLLKRVDCSLAVVVLFVQLVSIIGCCFQLVQPNLQILDLVHISFVYLFVALDLLCLLSACHSLAIQLFSQSCDDNLVLLIFLSLFPEGIFKLRNFAFLLTRFIKECGLMLH